MLLEKIDATMTIDLSGLEQPTRTAIRTLVRHLLGEEEATDAAPEPRRATEDAL